MWCLIYLANELSNPEDLMRAQNNIDIFLSIITVLDVFENSYFKNTKLLQFKSLFCLCFCFLKLQRNKSQQTETNDKKSQRESITLSNH